MRYFGGMSMPEVAVALGVSERTAAGDWAVARAWLRREIDAAGGTP
jgi:DNA-directed RNA polymerase specialized sigma24 family protein